MAYYAVSDDTVIIVNPKAGSMAMRSSISLTPYVEVNAAQALQYTNRVMFLRDPIERVNSLFNMFYHLASGCSDFSEVVPDGVITAHGIRVGSFVGVNDHRFKGQRKQKCDNAIAEERSKGKTDSEVTTALDNGDYERFIDHVLSGALDDHWGSQVGQSTHAGQLVANIVHPFSELNAKWQDYVIAPIEKENSWPAVAHADYKLAELQAYYSDDYALLGAL